MHANVCISVHVHAYVPSQPREQVLTAEVVECEQHEHRGHVGSQPVQNLKLERQKIEKVNVGGTKGASGVMAKDLSRM